MRKGQQGMASVVVVSVLVVIMTLISLGFARIMNRSINNANNRQASSTATYIAQSGINDVASYIKANPTAYSKSCTGNPSDPTSPSLIGNSTTPGPFYDDSNAVGSSAGIGGSISGAKYTCILLDQFPTDLLYQQISTDKSRVTKLTTTATAGYLDKIMLSWQASTPQNNGYSSSLTLNDQTTWNNQASGFCKTGGSSGSNTGCQPVLRVTIYPVPVGGDLTNTQANSKTIYLYPQTAVGNIPVLTYTGVGSFSSGSLTGVNCTTSMGNDASGKPNFNGSSNYACNVIFSNLSQIYSAPTKLDYVYMKITPIYGQADVRLQANDAFRQTLSFKYVQAKIDVTATYGGVAKRLQARVDTSTFTGVANSFKEDDNFGSNTDQVPDEALRTAVAVCKRFTSVSSPYQYLSFDQPQGTCHQDVNDNIPNPTTQLGISGTELNSAGSTYSVAPPGRLSTDNTPDAAHKGYLYVPTGGSASVNWSESDSSACTASWGAIPISGQTASGSYATGVISSPTSYTFQCSRDGISSGTQTVTAWPPPTATLTYPASITAGTPYTISWSSTNSTGCTLTGSWNTTGSNPNPSSMGAAFGNSQTMTEGLQDNTDKTFTVTCTDPFGRTASQTKTYTWTPPPGQPKTNLAPHCSATANAWDTQDGTVGYSWSSTCPDVNPALGTYSVTSSTDPSFSSNSSTGSGVTGLRTESQPFCIEVTASLSPWGQLADSNPPPHCATAYAPGDNGNPGCSASITPFDNGNGTGGFSWSGSCPPVDPGRGYYQLHDCTGIDCSTIGSGGWVGSSGTVGVGSGSYCIQFSSGADPWGFRAGAGPVCFTIYPPLQIYGYGGSGWSQSPECGPSAFYNGFSYNNTWWCRGSPTDSNGLGTKVTTAQLSGGGASCADGVHAWTACPGEIYWHTSGGGGTITCYGYVIGYGGSFGSSNNQPPNSPTDAYYSSPHLGWSGGGAISGWIYVNCSDTVGHNVTSPVF